MNNRQEQIYSCLHCNRPECINCIESLPKGKGTKPSILYEWKENMYSLKQLSEISGRSSSGLLHRIRIGGVDFAMSAFRTKGEYQNKEKEPEK